MAVPALTLQEEEVTSVLASALPLLSAGGLVRSSTQAEVEDALLLSADSASWAVGDAAALADFWGVPSSEAVTLTSSSSVFCWRVRERVSR